MTTLRIHGMGAAVPLTLSLSLAIRDALTSGSSEQNGDDAAVLLEIRTGSVDVGDEITPLLDVCIFFFRPFSPTLPLSLSSPFPSLLELTLYLSHLSLD